MRKLLLFLIIFSLHPANSYCWDRQDTGSVLQGIGQGLKIYAEQEEQERLEQEREEEEEERQYEIERIQREQKKQAILENKRELIRQKEIADTKESIVFMKNKLLEANAVSEVPFGLVMVRDIDDICNAHSFAVR